MPRGFQGGDTSRLAQMQMLDQVFQGLMEQFKKPRMENMQMEAWKLAMEGMEPQNIAQGLADKFPTLGKEEILKNAITAYTFKNKMGKELADTDLVKAQTENLRAPKPDSGMESFKKKMGELDAANEAEKMGWTQKVLPPGHSVFRRGTEGELVQEAQAPGTPKTPEELQIQKLRQQKLSQEVTKSSALANLMKQMPSDAANPQSIAAWKNAMVKQGFGDKIPKGIDEQAELEWRNQYNPDMPEEELNKYLAEGYRRGFTKTPPKSQKEKSKTELGIIAKSVGVDLEGELSTEDAKKVIAAVTAVKKERVKDSLFEVLSQMALTGKFHPEDLEGNGAPEYNPNRLDELRNKGR